MGALRQALLQCTVLCKQCVPCCELYASGSENISYFTFVVLPKPPGCMYLNVLQPLLVLLHIQIWFILT